MLLSSIYGHRTFSVRIVFSCRNIVMADGWRHVGLQIIVVFSIGQLARSNIYLDEHKASVRRVSVTIGLRYDTIRYDELKGE